MRLKEHDATAYHPAVPFVCPWYSSCFQQSLCNWRADCPNWPGVAAMGTRFLRQQGMYVTVHADVPYKGIVTASLTLNGVEVWWTKSDSKGNLVAKFDVESVKAIIEVPRATLELTGRVELPEEGIAYVFSGTDTVPVVDNGGK
jgi:hypothetical protein